TALKFMHPDDEFLNHALPVPVEDEEVLTWNKISEGSPPVVMIRKRPPPQDS
ncbi:hypothetical protein FRC17_006759, partial [Serendipita sp. 399]